MPGDVGMIGDSNVGADTISTALDGGTNVTITTDIAGVEAGDITQDSGAAIAWNTGSSLELQAEQDLA